jgi:hypothetical protein
MERATSQQLRAALDDLNGDIAREAFGRRREVALRLSALAREERLAERLSRWRRRAMERQHHLPDGDGADPVSIGQSAVSVITDMLKDADEILVNLNGTTSDISERHSAGAVARAVLAEDMAMRVTAELEDEIRRWRALNASAIVGKTNKAPRSRKRAGDVSLPKPALTTGQDVIREVEHEVEKNLLPVEHPPPLESRVLAEDEVQDGPRSALAPSPEDSVQEEGPAVLGASRGWPDRDEPRSLSVEVSLDPPADHPHVPSPSSPSTGVTAEQHEVIEAEVPSLLEDPRVNDEPPLTNESALTEQTSSIEGPLSTQASPLNEEPTSTEGPQRVAVDTSSSKAARTSPPSSLGSRDFTSPTTSSDHSPVRPPASSPLLGRSDRGSSPESDVLSDDHNGSSTRNSGPLLSEPRNAEASVSSVRSDSPTPESDSSSVDDEHLETSSTAHPLLEELRRTRTRYDELSRAFHDCHLSLQALKEEAANASNETPPWPTLRTVINRLDDVNEDARVELEIHIADEERLMEGYAALLALSGLSDTAEPSAESTIETEIQAFISGTDPKVMRSISTFNRKRDELEHDVANAKRVVHNLALGNLPPSSSPDIPLSLPSPDPGGSLPSDSLRGRKWSGWTNNLFSVSRSSSPAPPAFGNVMAAIPRLRASASATNIAARRTSHELAAPGAPNSLTHLGLDLMTPMPNHLSAPRPLTPTGFSHVVAPKPRYTSMFGQTMLGVGAARSLTPLAHHTSRSVTAPFMNLSAPRAGGVQSNGYFGVPEDDDVE